MEPETFTLQSVSPPVRVSEGRTRIDRGTVVVAVTVAETSDREVNCEVAMRRYWCNGVVRVRRHRSTTGVSHRQIGKLALDSGTAERTLA